MKKGEGAKVPDILKSKIVKLRVFEEDKLLADGRHVKVRYAIALYDMGLGKKPVLQLSAMSAKYKKKLIAGNVKDIPVLKPTEYGESQMKLVSIIRERLGSASDEECASFRAGHYLQLECHIE